MARALFPLFFLARTASKARCAPARGDAGCAHVRRGAWRLSLAAKTLRAGRALHEEKKTRAKIARAHEKQPRGTAHARAKPVRELTLPFPAALAAPFFPFLGEASEPEPSSLSFFLPIWRTGA